MTDRDKARVKKHKEETDQPMVISKFDKKKGKRTVYLVSLDWYHDTMVGQSKQWYEVYIRF